MITRVPTPPFAHGRTNPLTILALFGGMSFPTLAMAAPWNDPERVTHNTVEDRTTSGSLIHTCLNEAYAVWLQQQGEGWRIMWSKRDFNGWQEPQPIDPGIHQDHEPRLGLGPESEGLSAVWPRGDGSASEIMYAEKSFSGDWIVEPVTTNLTQDITPDLPPEGSTHIAWAGFDPQSQQGKIYHAVRTGLVWSIEVLAGSDPGPFWTGALPRIDVDGNGVVHVVYRGGDFGNYHLHYARKAGGAWTYQILTSLNGNDFSVDVVAPSPSEVLVAMSGNDCFGCGGRIFLRRSTDGGVTFGLPELVSGAFSANLSNLVVGVVGPVIVGPEVSGNFYTGNLIYARAGLPPEILPPLDLANESPCAGQGLCMSSQNAGNESVLFINHQGAFSDSAEVYFLASPGVGVGIDDGAASPVAGGGFHLRASPNPFSAWTQVVVESENKERFDPSFVEGAVYDLAGRLVRRLGRAASLRWDGNFDHGQPAPAGTYWVRVHAGKMTATTALVRMP